MPSCRCFDYICLFLRKLLYRDASVFAPPNPWP
ncbi:Protein of unknown function [Pyronema omphalodes CBS 100304]|uniref:Uncharacterized protein n=1 Tax=Pyronema omphalodes (strain CBS 100304) TaxID=1076935 RepID=U4LB22_PYROM|nr:Protein of unknown function [Pyronema omphalodes CBS 100304]